MVADESSTISNCSNFNYKHGDDISSNSDIQILLDLSRSQVHSSRRSAVQASIKKDAEEEEEEAEKSGGLSEGQIALEDFQKECLKFFHNLENIK